MALPFAWLLTTSVTRTSRSAIFICLTGASWMKPEKSAWARNSIRPNIFATEAFVHGYRSAGYSLCLTHALQASLRNLSVCWRAGAGYGGQQRDLQHGGSLPAASRSAG